MLAGGPSAAAICGGTSLSDPPPRASPEREGLLAVGYSTCHWCHVMEEESFQNKEIGAIMNENFVCIKVDREERPDVDKVYMTFVQVGEARAGSPFEARSPAPKRTSVGWAEPLVGFLHTLMSPSGYQRWRRVADERLADSGPEALCRGDVFSS